MFHKIPRGATTYFVYDQLLLRKYVNFRNSKAEETYWAIYLLEMLGEVNFHGEHESGVSKLLAKHGEDIQILDDRLCYGLQMVDVSVSLVSYRNERKMIINDGG